MKLINLEEAFKKLNMVDVCIDEETGEDLSSESMYSFKYKVDKNNLIIYDEKEQFNINLDDEIEATVYEASKEFGFKFIAPESTVEKVLDVFKKALEKDLKKAVNIEWVDGVVLGVYLN